MAKDIALRVNKPELARKLTDRLHFVFPIEGLSPRSLGNVHVRNAVFIIPHVRHHVARVKLLPGYHYTLTAPNKTATLTPADQGAPEIEERLVDVGSPLVAHL